MEGNQYTVELQQCIGKINILNGDYEAAKMILIQCLTMQKADHDDTSIVLFRTMYYLGVALHHMGQHSHSLTILLSAENILHSSDNDTDIRIALIHFWAGREYFVEKQYQQSASYLSRALAEYKEFSGIEDIEMIVQTLHSLGNAQSAMGENELALKSYNSAVTLVEKEGKMQCTKSYAEVLFSTGKLYYTLKTYEAARICYNKSLQFLPVGSSDKVAVTMDALGAVFIKQMKYDDARAVLTGAYNIFKQSNGQKSDCKISTAYQLAQLLDLMHEHKPANEYYEICLKAMELKYGKTHIAVGTILFKMGKNLLSQFEYDSTLACLERVSKHNSRDHFCDYQRQLICK
jgi:tetratricopeptide (TPR) repeat protein